MTLEEAIKHATEIADHYDELIKTNNHGWGFNGSNENCVKCAKEHKQLVEWLEELKRFRKMKENIKSLNVTDIDMELIWTQKNI